MAKNVVKLNESELTEIVKSTISKILKESTDEISPEFLIHASHAAALDKKKHPGRGKDSKDPALRAKRDRQIAAFGDRAADLINQEIDDPDFLAIGDRGVRRGMWANDGKSAYLNNDIEDLDSVKVYDDNYAEGDEPLTVGGLTDDEREKIAGAFGKFKGYHDRAKELDDKYLEEIVKKTVKNIVKENIEFEMQADEMINKAYENLKSGNDNQEILDWLDEHFYDLNHGQQEDFKQLWDAEMRR